MFYCKPRTLQRIADGLLGVMDAKGLHYSDIPTGEYRILAGSLK